MAIGRRAETAGGACGESRPCKRIRYQPWSVALRGTIGSVVGGKIPPRAQDEAALASWAGGLRLNALPATDGCQMDGIGG